MIVLYILDNYFTPTFFEKQLHIDFHIVHIADASRTCSLFTEFN